MKRLAILVLFAACRSPSSHYYTLAAPPSAAPASGAIELQLDILPVDVPADVDRSEIVVRTGTGEVTPVETRSWIAPLSREIRRAFSDDLTSLLAARDVAGLASGGGMPTFRVKLAVKRFDSLLGKSAVIEAVSTVRDISKEDTLVCSHRAVENAKAGYDGIAEAHQRALATIAKQVADSVRSIQAGSPACAQK